MPHILIVEDESATAWALCESLEDEGHRTTHVSSAEDALAAVDRDHFDLVITDIRLPGMSGLNLARQLIDELGSIPILVVTAYGSREEADELKACGVSAVFRKPFRVDQIRRYLMTKYNVDVLR